MYMNRGTDVFSVVWTSISQCCDPGWVAYSILSRSTTLQWMWVNLLHVALDLCLAWGVFISTLVGPEQQEASNKAQFQESTASPQQKGRPSKTLNILINNLYIVSRSWCLCNTLSSIIHGHESCRYANSNHKTNVNTNTDRANGNSTEKAHYLGMTDYLEWRAAPCSCCCLTSYCH